MAELTWTKDPNYTTERKGNGTVPHSTAQSVTGRSFTILRTAGGKFFLRIEKDGDTFDCKPSSLQNAVKSAELEAERDRKVADTTEAINNDPNFLCIPRPTAGSPSSTGGGTSVADVQGMIESLREHAGPYTIEVSPNADPEAVRRLTEGEQSQNPTVGSTSGNVPKVGAHPDPATTEGEAYTPVSGGTTAAPNHKLVKLEDEEGSDPSPSETRTPPPSEPTGPEQPNATTEPPQTLYTNSRLHDDGLPGSIVDFSDKKHIILTESTRTLTGEAALNALDPYGNLIRPILPSQMMSPVVPPETIYAFVRESLGTSGPPATSETLSASRTRKLMTASFNHPPSRKARRASR